MEPKASVASNWRLNDETPITACEGCRKVNPPIYETVYQLRTCPAQYHYYCSDCATKHLGKARFEADRGAIAERVKQMAENRKNSRTAKKAAE